MKKMNVTTQMLKAQIAMFADVGRTQISRQLLSDGVAAQWSHIGECPIAKASGSGTTKIMKKYGPQFGYTFLSDGRTKGGNYINPRLVKGVSEYAEC